MDSAETEFAENFNRLILECGLSLKVPDVEGSTNHGISQMAKHPVCDTVAVRDNPSDSTQSHDNHTLLSEMAASTSSERVESHTATADSKNVTVDVTVNPKSCPAEPTVQHNAVPVMDIAHVREKLVERGLRDRGSDYVLRTRLKMAEASDTRPAEFTESLESHGLDFLIVVDFEATCEESRPPGTYDQEIIEFPAVLIDVKQKEIVGEFHEYVRPQKNKHLSDFCTSLTGISQTTVNAADLLPAVLLRFRLWLFDKGLVDNTRWCIVTDGSFDIALFLHCSCKLSSVGLPAHFKLFIHLPKLFQWIYLSDDPLRQRANMAGMLEHLDLLLEGRHHSGIDDAKNLARICVQMLVDGVRFRPTDAVDVTKPDERKPFCALVKPVHKKQWLVVHKKAMAKLAEFRPSGKGSR